MRYSLNLLAIALALHLTVEVAAKTPQREPVPLSMVSMKGELIPVYNMKQVQPLKTYKPAYPVAQRRNGVDGTTEIAVLVNPEGRVEDAEVRLSKPTSDFGDASLVCVKKWLFPKLEREGKPTKYLIIVPVVYCCNSY